MKSDATTVEAYLGSLPEDRRAAVSAVRAVILKNLPKGYAETIGYGMITYVVPKSIYPAGYHCDPRQPLPFLSLAAQKNHLSLYMFCLYMDSTELDRFREEWLATGKRLDMGKSCVRFKRAEDVPLEVVGRAVKRATLKKFVGSYEVGLAQTSKVTAKKVPTKKASAKKGGGGTCAAKAAKEAGAKKRTPAKKAARR